MRVGLHVAPSFYTIRLQSVFLPRASVGRVISITEEEDAALYQMTQNDNMKRRKHCFSTSKSITANYHRDELIMHWASKLSTWEDLFSV